MSTSDSFVVSDAAPLSEHDDVDSLASLSSDDLSSVSESDAQREWEASLEQLQLILTMVMIPFVGKYFGRKFAYWSTFYFQTYLPCSFLTHLVRLGTIHGVVSQRRDTMDE